MTFFPPDGGRWRWSRSNGRWLRDVFVSEPAGDAHRQTGRTTRMLWRVLSAPPGAWVYVAAADHRHAADMRRRLAQLVVETTGAAPNQKGDRLWFDDIVVEFDVGVPPCPIRFGPCLSIDIVRGVVAVVDHFTTERTTNARQTNPNTRPRSPRRSGIATRGDHHPEGVA